MRPPDGGCWLGVVVTPAADRECTQGIWVGGG
jgi:hypothetical protein